LKKIKTWLSRRTRSKAEYSRIVQRDCNLIVNVQKVQQRSEAKKHELKLDNTHSKTHTHTNTNTHAKR